MPRLEYAYFAGGCFWCITPTFREMDGVQEVTSGYSGGDECAPTYLDVKYQRTGHRETIRIAFDPQQVAYDTLMAVFLNSVDPFDGGGQFIDRGYSYTLAVYYASQEQLQAAQVAMARLEAAAGKPVQIALEPFKNFYTAEEEHQNYDLKNPQAFARELVESGRRKADT